MPLYDAKYDLNKDGVIDAEDSMILRKFYLQRVADNPAAVIADFDGDGKVTAVDAGIFLDHYGAFAGQLSTSKEPTQWTPPVSQKTAWGLIIGALILLSLIFGKGGK